MIKSLTKLIVACLRLISTFCRLLTSLGCLGYYNPSSSSPKKASLLGSKTATESMTHSNGVKHHHHNSQTHHLNGYANGFTAVNGKSASNGTIVRSTTATLPNGYVLNGVCNGGTVTTTTTATILNGKHEAVQNGYLKTDLNSSCLTLTSTITSTTSPSKHSIEQQSNGHLPQQQPHSPSPKTPLHHTARPQCPMYMILLNYLCHGTLFLFGHLNDSLRKWGVLESFERVERNREGYPSLYSSFATFYVRNIIQRLINMWCHPISSVPGAVIDILERKFGPYNAAWKYTGKILKVINMGSYNYLGYAENEGPRIEAVQEDITKGGVGLSAAPNELGTYDRFVDLEAKVAQFLGVEDSVVVGMGFATNALCLPCLFGPGCLVISDQNNHASLALGCKLSGAKIRVFKHNDMKHLEKLLREAIAYGQPCTAGKTTESTTGSVRRGEPWKKIIIIVEGIYSMEGTIVNLPEVIRLKKQYKAYLYMDEAHSIGAMGARGRGICDYYGCDPRDVDILMGTFTKSFAAAGGYIAGSRDLISYIRSSSPSYSYCTTMAPPVVNQISFILDQFLAMDRNNNHQQQQHHHLHPRSPVEDPQKDSAAVCDVLPRIVQLRKNTHMFRQRLKALGFHIDGDDDSPVVPIMVYSPSLLKCLISELLSRGIASTGAAFPVTSLIGIRARFCLSASHTDEMIDYTISCLDEIGTKIGIKFDAK